MGFLILRRKPGERLIFTLPDGREFSIKVDDYAERAVKLLIDAPEDVKIAREELLERTEA